MTTYKLSDVTVAQWEHGMHVGCKRDALRALATHLHTFGPREDMPQNMRPMAQAGRGLMRQTYIDDRSRVVYKLRTSGWHDVATLVAQNAANVSEYRTMSALAAHKSTRTYASPVAVFYVHGVAVIAMLARTTGDGNVIAECKRRAMLDAFAAFTRATGVHIGDMHNGNFRATPTKRPRVTDVGAVYWGHASLTPSSDPTPCEVRAVSSRHVSTSTRGQWPCVKSSPSDPARMA